MHVIREVVDFKSDPEAARKEFWPLVYEPEEEPSGDGLGLIRGALLGAAMWVVIGLAACGVVSLWRYLA